ncbi:MAG: hypothetical protein WBE76_11625, partial [Terracidiphilus sp.]
MHRTAKHWINGEWQAIGREFHSINAHRLGRSAQTRTATSPDLGLPFIDALNLLFPRLCQLLHQRHERHVDGLIYRWRE